MATVRSLVLNPLIGYIQDSEEPVYDLFCVEDHRLLPAPGVGCIKLNQERVLPTSGSGNRELSALRVSCTEQDWSSCLGPVSQAVSFTILEPHPLRFSNKGATISCQAKGCENGPRSRDGHTWSDGPPPSSGTLWAVRLRGSGYPCTLRPPPASAWPSKGHQGCC